MTKKSKTMAVNAEDSDQQRRTEKRRFWSLSNRDFCVLVGSFEPVKKCFYEAQAAFDRDELTLAILDELKEAAYNFDKVAHVVFELNLGFDQEMSHYKTDKDRVSFTDVIPLFDAVAAHIDRLIEYQPTGKADCRDLEKLHQLSGVLACGTLRVMDDLFQDDESVDTLATACENAEFDDKPLLPDFGHRLSPIGRGTNALALADTVSMMVNKAESVLSMLGNAFSGEDEQIRPSDDAVYYSLQSVSHELSDIKAVVSAFHQAAKIQRA